MTAANAALLVELHTEELPPKALQALATAFAEGIAQGLRSRQLLAENARFTPFGTPRRLAVHIDRVLAQAPDQAFEQKLVPVAVGLDGQGAPTPALLKKLTALGAPTTPAAIAALARRHDGKQDVLVWAGTRAGATLPEGLQAALDASLAALPIPRTMSYQLVDGATTVQFVRPAQRLLALHGSAIVPVQALGLAAGRSTRSHRFHGGELEITSADTYETQLRTEGKVIASFDARREAVRAALLAAAAREHATPLMPDALLDEVNALVEWPVVYASGFDPEFLEVPDECLVLTMQQHQRYFALRDAQGALKNRFLLVSPLEATDGGAAIVGGNARVVRARLADARFFYEQDRKATLESRIPGLANVVYHGRLGSQLARVERVTGLAVALASALGVDRNHAERAARLAKADLRTLMVGEFPELQGVMGEYYARHDGEADDVATAIREHYQPRFAGDALPATKVGTVVALADKLETLAGLFGIGQLPTGDRDPYALRRHALGVLRMLMDGQGRPLALDTLVAQACAAFADVPGVDLGPATQTALLDFFHDRLRGLLRDEGYSANEVEAVVSLRPAAIGAVRAQLEAVRVFAALPEAASLAAANKRIGNILKKSDEAPVRFDRALALEPAEQALATALAEVAPRAHMNFAAGDYTAMLSALAPLKLPVDAFFDGVMVNVDDARLRRNRLALLAELHALMNRVADLSRLAPA